VFEVVGWLSYAATTGRESSNTSRGGGGVLHVSDSDVGTVSADSGVFLLDTFCFLASDGPAAPASVDGVAALFLSVNR